MDDHNQRLTDGAACLDAALKYLALGWSVLSLCPPDHVGIGKDHVKNCSSPGKRPWHTWADFQIRLPTEDEVREWWRIRPNANGGMALGPVSGIIRIDVEGDSGEKKLLEFSGGDLPETLEFKSGRSAGGRGLLYGIPDGVNLATTFEKPKPNEEVRFQACGAQTVLPPSRHPSGTLYEWVNGKSPFQGQANLAPAWLIEKMIAKDKGEDRRSREDWENIFRGSQSGSRNDNMTAIAGRLIRSLADLNDSAALHAVWMCLLAINDRDDPPMQESEVKQIFTSVLRMEKRRREELEDGKLDSFIADEIEKSKGKAEDIKASPPPVNSHELNGHAKELPDCHLVIVKSDPAEYRLRMPWWKDSPDLKDGYLSLTASQVQIWSKICEAAFAKSHTVVDRKAVKGWGKTDGQLKKLVDSALVIERAPESKRPLFVLGFIYRFLIDAKPPRKADDGTLPIIGGRSPILLDDRVLFKLDSLKRKVKDVKEDFTHQEIMRAIQDTPGFGPEKFQNSRWWHISISHLNQIGKVTDQPQNPSFSAPVRVTEP